MGFRARNLNDPSSNLGITSLNGTCSQKSINLRDKSKIRSVNQKKRKIKRKQTSSSQDNIILLRNNKSKNTIMFL